MTKRSQKVKIYIRHASADHQHAADFSLCNSQISRIKKFSRIHVSLKVVALAEYPYTSSELYDPNSKMIYMFYTKYLSVLLTKFYYFI